MATLPTPGGDSGTWGDELNEWLLVGHDTDGTNLGGGAVAAADVTVDSTTLVGTGTDVQAVFEELDDAIVASVPKSLYDANTVLAATSDNTPAAITMGASTTLARLAAGNIVAATVAEMGTLLGPSMPGYELAYVQSTSNLTSTQTTQASATTWLTAPSITFDGSTAILIHFYTSRMTNSASGVQTLANVWQDSTDLSSISRTVFFAAGDGVSTSGFLRITPTAGAKVYTIRGWVSGASTGTALGGAGTGGGTPPAFLRITRV